MARILVFFIVMGVFFAVGGLLEKIVPERVWDKVGHLLRFD